MPQMHPLMWTLLLAFSLICLVFVISIIFFSCNKPNFTKPSAPKAQTKNLTWKW